MSSIKRFSGAVAGRVGGVDDIAFAFCFALLFR